MSPVQARVSTGASRPADVPGPSSTSRGVGGLGRRMGRTVATSVTWLLLVGALLSLAVALAGRVAGRGTFEVLGHPIFVMASGSMAPVIRTGDLVIDDKVSPAREGRLEVGQIVTFSTPGSALVISHRIHAVRTTPAGMVTYLTKGDANEAVDLEPVDPRLVLGTLHTSIPYAGSVLDALHRPVVLVLLLASPLLWLASSAFFRAAHAGPRFPGTTSPDLPSACAGRDGRGAPRQDC